MADAKFSATGIDIDIKDNGGETVTVVINPNTGYKLTLVFFPEEFDLFVETLASVRQEFTKNHGKF